VKKWELEVFLDQLGEKNMLERTEKEIILEIVKTLIPEQTTDTFTFNPKKPELKSFSYPRNYHKYFSYRLFEGDISEFELEQYRIKAYKEYYGKVVQWRAEGMGEALRERLRPISAFYDIEEFENHIRINFFIGRNDFKGDQWMSQEYNYVLNALAYPTKGGLKLYNDIKVYEEFLLQLFAEAEPPALFDSTLISTLITINLEIALSWEQLEKINFDYLYSYGSATDKITPELWRLYQNCKIRSTIPADDYEDDPKAKYFFLNKYKELTRSRDLAQFIIQSRPYSKKLNLRSDLCAFVAGTMGDFESWVDALPNVEKDSQSYKEFKDFLELSRANRFDPVEFSFDHLVPGMYQ
jgi:hypothetical protein